MGKYDDILYRKPPVADKHSRMKNSDRAKQFAPFAALKGYEEAIKAQERQYSPPIILSEHRKAEINHVLCQLQIGDKITVDYYRNGEYHTIYDSVLKIDKNRHLLIFDGCEVGIDTIKDIHLEGTSDSNEGC